MAISEKLAGIYVLCLPGRIVYIGQTSNLHKRIKVHDSLRRRGIRLFDHLLLLRCDSRADRLRVERILIRQYNSERNLLRKPDICRKSYVELRADFKRLVELDLHKLLTFAPK